ncbi:MAG: FecR family protein [Candidatus Omnitrophica bacterium]|nr:FecR family protein [Candidatus Omnitrophota bacterium]
MRKIFFLVCTFSVLVFSLFAQEVGKLTAVEGRVDIIQQGKLPAIEAKLNQSVYLKDIIRTKTDSRAEITFKDGSVIKIAQRSRVDISEYLTDGGGLKAQILLQRGRLGAYVPAGSVEKIKSSPKANRFEIKTPVAVAGVRGTNFIVSHYVNEATTVLVISGIVYSYNLNFPENIVGLRDGEMTVIKEKTPPTPPVPAAPEDISRIQISLNPERENLLPLTEKHLPSLGPVAEHFTNNIDLIAFWVDDLQMLEGVGMEATFSGEDFWTRTPADALFQGNIIDVSNQIELSSGKGYLWGTRFYGRDSEYFYAGYSVGSLVPDDGYNMNARIVGLYSDDLNNKGIFIGTLAEDGSANINFADKSFSLQGEITSAVSLGAGNIEEPLIRLLPQAPIIDSFIPDVEISNCYAEATFDTNDDNYTFGVGVVMMGGIFEMGLGFKQPVGLAQDFYVAFQSGIDGLEPGILFGGVTEGILPIGENGLQNLSGGKTFGYFVDTNSPSFKTGIFVGETAGTFNPAANSAWQTITAGSFIETNTLLNLLNNDSGKQKLNSIGIPVVEIGSDTLTYNNNNPEPTDCITSIMMSNVKFFANSMGDPPTIWATNQVNGTFAGTVPTIDYSVILQGQQTGIKVNFAPKIWTENKWAAVISSNISGAQQVSNFTIERMDGYAAGTISGNTFSGTAAGAVRAIQPQ